MKERQAGGQSEANAQFFHLASLQHLPTRRVASRVAGLCSETAEGCCERSSPLEKTRPTHVGTAEKPGTNNHLRAVAAGDAHAGAPTKTGSDVKN